MTTLMVILTGVSDRGDVSIRGLVMKGVLRPGMKWNVEGKSFAVGRIVDRGADALGKVKELKEAKEGQAVQVFLIGADALTVNKLQRKQNIEFL